MYDKIVRADESVGVQDVVHI